MSLQQHLRRLALAAAASAFFCGAAAAQTLTIGVRAGPDSIDPHFTATGTHAEALKHVFDTLVWSGDKLQLEPRLATSWKAVDPTTWEFKLREGVKFHDGSDFTAEDVKFSIERIPIVDRARTRRRSMSAASRRRRSSIRTRSTSSPTVRRRPCRTTSSACSSSRRRRPPA